MTRALIFKELRELLPYGFMCLVLGLLDLVPVLLTQPDMRPLGITIGGFGDNSAFFYWVLALAIGTVLSTREQDDRTLGFLDGLPITRIRVFLVKLGVTVTLIMLAPLMSMAVLVIEHLLSRGSLDYALHPLLLLQVLGLELLLIVHAVCVGAALGRLRHLTWLTLGCAAILLERLVDAHPAAGVLNPLTLLDVPITSAGLAIDAGTVWVQVGVAAAALAIAGYAFTHADRSHKLLNAPARPLVGTLIGLASLGVIVTALVLWLPDDMKQPPRNDDEAEEPQFATSPPAQTSTRHYQFAYPAHNANKALALAAQADAIFERVHALLHIAPGEPIAVDATGSMANTAGTAFFGRIRMALDDESPVVVLAHESAHVAARRIAGNTKVAKWQEASVLDEGLAWWVDSHFEGAAPRGDGLLVLAALQTRRELRIDAIFDAGRLEESYGPELQYPTGEALIAATVKLYGEESLPRLLGAFGDARLASDLRGEPLWQAAFQLAAMDLGAVVDEFYREVSTYAREHAAEIAALPRPRVRVIEYGKYLGVQPLVDVDDPDLEIHLRFKPEPDSEVDQLDYEVSAPSDPVWRKASSISGGKICVQAGIERGSQVLFEPWTCLPTADAVEWEPPEEEEDDE